MYVILHTLYTDIMILVNCPPGSYQVLDIKKVVDENDGRITQYIAPKCVTCPIGYYQDKQGFTTCKQCPSGHTTLTSGAHMLEECLRQCSPGEFSQNGLKPCLPCPNGMHSFINGSTTCYNCSDETYQLLCPIHKISKDGYCVYICMCVRMSMFKEAMLSCCSVMKLFNIIIMFANQLLHNSVNMVDNILRQCA